MEYMDRLPRYVGAVHPNCDYHHGQIPPARGVKCWQVARANRTHPERDDGTGCTYKHAADLTWFHGRFYIQYLCNPEDEHTGAGLSVLASSPDGRVWEDYTVSFPPYRIPACTITDYKGGTHMFDGTTCAFMHQRMSFYRSPTGRMLVLGFYGWSPEPWMTNWDNYGIGRVARELYPDGSLSPIHFIRPAWQGGWEPSQLLYPLYTEAEDPGFREACEALLSDRLAVQQWAEENGDQDEIITLKHSPDGVKNEAFCWYHLEDGSVVGLWKHSLTSRSYDEGKTWLPVTKSPSLVMSGQKVWGCRTGDGRYAMVYDPTLETQHRYPLCVTTSEDGLAFDNMLLVHGEVPPMRFKGFWKDMGPQYMRGISEGMERPGENLWIAYSVNKEDIWIAEIPVPVTGEETAELPGPLPDAQQAAWNLYSPKWATVSFTASADGACLRLTDRDPYDYSRAERLFPLASSKRVAFSLRPMQNDTGCLHVELCDPWGRAGIRLVFRPDGKLYARTVTELPVAPYQAEKRYDIALEVDCETFSYTISINGAPVRDNKGQLRWRFMAAVNALSRFVLRTGDVRHTPTLDDDPENKPETPLPGGDTPCREAVFELLSLETGPAR